MEITSRRKAKLSRQETSSSQTLICYIAGYCRIIIDAGKFLSRLKYIIVDEVHSYRGAFVLMSPMCLGY